MLPNRHTESHSKSGTAVSGAHHSARETMDGGLTDAMRRRISPISNCPKHEIEYRFWLSGQIDC